MNLTDYTSQTINLTSDYEGEVTATLVASNSNTNNRKSVLYLHGYVDYFFHPHVGEHFNQQGYDFYALDLRKYGRSLLEHQHPNYCRNVEEYYEEITFSIRQMYETCKSDILLLGHSTGGLIACNYMNTGAEKHRVKGLILNSPFLDFNQTNLQKKLVYGISKIISSFSNYLSVNGALSPIYPKSLHKDYYGEWDFNLAWKPIKGFPTYFPWLLAIHNAQQSLKTSHIDVPILLLHSSGSKTVSKFSEAAMTHDIVLDVTDMTSIGATLGPQVTLSEVKDAMHDIFLSPKPIRDTAFALMFTWLEATETLP